MGFCGTASKRIISQYVHFARGKGGVEGLVVENLFVCLVFNGTSTQEGQFVPTAEG